MLGIFGLQIQGAKENMKLGTTELIAEQDP